MRIKERSTDQGIYQICAKNGEKKTYKSTRKLVKAYSQVQERKLAEK